MRFTYLFLLTSLLFLSCEKDTFDSSVTPEDLVWVPGVTFPTFDLSENAHLTVVANGSGWTDAPPSFDIYGSIVDGQGNPTGFDGMAINGQEMEISDQAREGFINYHFNELQEARQDAFQSILSSFEQERPFEVKISGAAQGDIFASVTMPLRLEMSLLGNRSYVENPSTIRPADDIIVKWNAPANSERNPADVGIAVLYNPGFSRLEDPSLPSSLPIWFEATEDDGEFVIPGESLEYFPKGALITVSVARGVFENYTYQLNGNELIVNGITYEVSQILEVLE